MMPHHTVDIPSEYLMCQDCLGNQAVLAKRVAAVEEIVARKALDKVLRYLYLPADSAETGVSRSILNMDTASRQLAEPYLSQGEIIMSRYLASRTNGNGKQYYGKPALHRMRQARYCCEKCNSPDTRTLVLDHTVGRKVNPTILQVLCANCHQIKSRQYDWLGTPRS